MKVTFKINSTNNKPIGVRDSRGILYPENSIPPLDSWFHELDTRYTGFYAITEGQPRMYPFKDYLNLAPDDLVKVHIPGTQLQAFPVTARGEAGVYFRAIDLIPLAINTPGDGPLRPRVNILAFVNRDQLPENLEGVDLRHLRGEFSIIRLSEGQRNAYFEAEDDTDRAGVLYGNSPYYRRINVPIDNIPALKKKKNKKLVLKPRPNGICSSRELRNTEARFARCIRSLEPLRIKGKVYAILQDGSYIVDGIPTFAKNKVFICLSPIEEYFINPETGESSISTKRIFSDNQEISRVFNVDNPIYLNEDLTFNVKEINQFTEVNIITVVDKETGTRSQVIVKFNEKATLDIPYRDDMTLQEVTDVINLWDNLISHLMKSVKIISNIGPMADKISKHLRKHFQLQEILHNEEFEKKVQKIQMETAATFNTTIDSSVPPRYFSDDDIDFFFSKMEEIPSKNDTEQPVKTTGGGFEMHMLKSRGAGFNHSFPAGYTRRVKRNKKKGGW